jgi:hypothetical protein
MLDEASTRGAGISFSITTCRIKYGVNLSMRRYPSYPQVFV